MPTPTFHVFPDPAAVAQAAAVKIAQLADDSVKKRNRFSLALSGGSTPKAVYEVLASDFADKIPWDRVHIWWSDERCVPWDHPDSNAHMATQTLLSKVPVQQAKIHRVQTTMTRAAAASAYDQALRRFNVKTPLDLILLGIGTDGHTASLFPGSGALTEPSRWVVSTTAPPGAPSPDRVTFTFPLLATAPLLFIATGDSKRPVVNAIKSGAQPPSPAQIACQRSPSDWFIDAAADG